MTRIVIEVYKELKKCLIQSTCRTNEKVLDMVDESRVLMEMIIRRQKNLIGHVLRGEDVKEVIKLKLYERKDAEEIVSECWMF